MKLSELLTVGAGAAIAVLTTTPGGYVLAGALLGGALTSAAKNALDRAYWGLDSSDKWKKNR